MFGFYFLMTFLIPVISSLPEFAEPIPNITVSVGREAMLQCTVDNLQHFKVAWIKMNTETLLAIHTQVITRDRRFRVSNNSNKQWYLHIKDVQMEDRGYYMCQINTEPMVSQVGYLDIMVPPSIVENGTSSDVSVEERAKVTLRCQASGYPTPTVSWRREDGKDINMGSFGGRRYSVLASQSQNSAKVEGEYLNISQVSREDMGAYLCIASNGIPPSVSKRILIQVKFRPKIRVPNQLVGAAAKSYVILECRVEAFPPPLISWIRIDGMLLLSNNKYELIEDKESYKITMKIKIFDLSENDFGSYKCVAKNALGEKEGFIRLYEIIPVTTSTPLARTTSTYEVYLPRIRGLKRYLNRVNLDNTCEFPGFKTKNSSVFPHIKSTDSQIFHNDSYAQKKIYDVQATISLMDESHVSQEEQETVTTKSEETAKETELPTKYLKSPPSKNSSCKQYCRQSKIILHLLLFTTTMNWSLRTVL